MPDAAPRLEQNVGTVLPVISFSRRIGNESLAVWIRLGCFTA